VAHARFGSIRDTNLSRTQWKNLLEDRTPTKPIAGMRQADAPVGGLRIAVATGVPQEPAVKAGGRHLSNALQK
jgi:hypothetical protein